MKLPDDIKGTVTDLLNQERAGTLTEEKQLKLNELRARGFNIAPRPRPGVDLGRTAAIMSEEAAEAGRNIRRGVDFQTDSLLLRNLDKVNWMDPLRLPLGLAQLWFILPNTLARQAGERVTEQTGSPVLGSITEFAGAGIGGGLQQRGLQAVGRAAKFLPGGQAARAEMAIEDAQGLPGDLLPDRPSVELYKEVAKYNPKIQASNFRAELSRLADIEEKSGAIAKSSILLKRLKGESKLFNEADDFIDFNQLRLEYAGINAEIGRHVRTGGKELGVFKSLKAALQRDLDDAIVRGTTKEAAEGLRKAAFAMRKELASERLGRIIEQSISERRGGVIDINPQTILKRLRTDKFFKDRLEPGEMQKIRQTLIRLNQNPPVPPPGSTDVGFGRIASIGASGYAAAQLANFLPGVDLSQQAAVGIGAGLVAARAIIAKALMSDFGRRKLIELSRAGPVSLAKVGALAASLRMANKAMRLGQNMPQSKGQQLQTQVQGVKPGGQ